MVQLTSYTYAWNDAVKSNDSNSNRFSSRYLQCTVTDANACTSTSSVTITEPTALTSSITASTNVDCNANSTGSATVTATGGKVSSIDTPGGGSGYTYMWSNGATTASISNVAAGTYTVTITDENMCTTTSSVTITEPTVLTSSITASTNVDCNGNSTGSATVTGAGGTTGYTYLWSDGMAQTGAMATGLAAGMYSVVVTDANNCTSTSMVTITEPMVLASTTLQTQQASCSGGNDGKAEVNVTGGTMPYTYAWAHGATTDTITGLAAGTYMVTVTDANGCMTTNSVAITSPSGLAASTSIFSNVSCNGGTDGSVNLTVTGGTMPFTYTWNNGATTEDIFNVAAGAYTVMITDANGCSLSVMATVTEPTALTASTSMTNVSCNGGTDGTANLAVTGGTAPYFYSWNNGALTDNLTGLAAGAYMVTVTDANGCMTTATAMITEPMALTAIATATDASCNGAADGTVTVTTTGGTAGYAYLWDDASAQTTAMATALAAGTYNVMITDTLGCTTTASATVNEPTAISITATTSDASCNGTATGGVDITVTGGYGQVIHMLGVILQLQKI